LQLVYPEAHRAALQLCNHLLQDYDRIMGTNLESTYTLVQLLQPLLAAGAAGGPQQQQQQAADTPLDPISRAMASPKGDACIVFISSVAGGPLAGRSGSLYAASKAALNQLAASFACEWASQGIRVNSVAPWVTLTELGQQVGVTVHVSERVRW
jgi:Tropinone reductase 1